MVGNPHRTSARAKLLGSLDGCGAAEVLTFAQVMRLGVEFDDFAFAQRVGSGARSFPSRRFRRLT
jgi:hypothetical protein